MSVYSEGHQAATCFGGYSAGRFFVLEPAETDSLPVDVDLRRPSLLISRPVDATEAGSAASMARAVLHVSDVRDDAQVPPTIVEPITAHVIDLIVSGVGIDSQDDMVHQNALSPALFTIDPSTGVAGTVQTPALTVDQMGVRCIDNGISPNAAIAGIEWDADSILKAHQALQRSGVTPPAVSAARGHSAASILPSLPDMEVVA